MRESLGPAKPKGIMKVKARLARAEGGWASAAQNRRVPHSRGVSLSSREEAHP